MAGPYTSANRGTTIGFQTATDVITPALIANESLYRLKNNLLAARLANRTYNQIFQSEMPGNEITVKAPFYYTLPADDANSGNRVLNTYSHVSDESLTIKLDKRIRGGLQFADSDKTLTIKDFGERYLQPVVEEMAEKVEEDAMAELVYPESSPLYVLNGAPLTAFVPKSAQQVREVFTLQSIPERDNYCLINPGDFISISDDLREVNTSLPAGTMMQTMVESRYKGMLSDFNVFISNKIPKYTQASTAGTLTVDAALTAKSGSGNSGVYDTIAITGSTAATVLKKGSYFTVAGVYERGIRGDRASSDRLFRFRVEADATLDSTSGNNVDVTVREFSVDNRAYPCVSSLPAAGGRITVISATNAKHQIFWCRDAFEMLNVVLATPDAATRTGTKTDPMTGISMTYVEDFEIDSLSTKMRIDAVYAFKLLRPELCAVNLST